MQIGPIVKTTVGHCVGAVVVCAAFAGAQWTIVRIYPNGTLRWWADEVEYVLVYAVVGMLGLIFLNSMLRIALDAFVETWKGFPNGKNQIFLV